MRVSQLTPLAQSLHAPPLVQWPLTVCLGVGLEWCLGAAMLPLSGSPVGSPFPPFYLFSPSFISLFAVEVTYESWARIVDRGIRYH